MSKKEAYEKKLEGQLEEWSATIDKLKAKAKQESGEAEKKYHERIEALEAEREAAKDKLHEFKNKSDNAWEDMKTGMDNAWQSLSNAVSAARSQFDNK